MQLPCPYIINIYKLTAKWQNERFSPNKFIYIVYKDGLLLPSLILEIIRLQHTTW